MSGRLRTRAEAVDALSGLNLTLSCAVQLLREHVATIDQFFEEKRSMENVGSILDPTLFNSSERRATEALLAPVYRAARDFVATYDAQVARALEALAKVSTGDAS